MDTITLILTYAGAAAVAHTIMRIVSAVDKPTRRRKNEGD